jgi:hypothetical protein
MSTRALFSLPHPVRGGSFPLVHTAFVQVRCQGRIAQAFKLVKIRLPDNLLY